MKIIITCLLAIIAMPVSALQYIPVEVNSIAISSPLVEPYRQLDLAIGIDNRQRINHFSYVLDGKSFTVSADSFQAYSPIQLNRISVLRSSIGGRDKAKAWQFPARRHTVKVRIPYGAPRECNPECTSQSDYIYDAVIFEIDLKEKSHQVMSDVY